MTVHLRYLLPHEGAALRDYTRRLQESVGDRLTGLWLFGSKARGDSDSDSDIDLLVVVTGEQPDTRWRIWGLGADVSLEYDVLFNAHIVHADRWQEECQYRGTLWREIERDGVPLLGAWLAPTTVGPS